MGKLIGTILPLGDLISYLLTLNGLILVPSLLAGWATRGYRLKVTKRPAGQGDAANRA